MLIVPVGVKQLCSCLGYILEDLASARGSNFKKLPEDLSLLFEPPEVEDLLISC